MSPLLRALSHGIILELCFCCSDDEEVMGDEDEEEGDEDEEVEDVEGEDDEGKYRARNYEKELPFRRKCYKKRYLSTPI